MFADAVIEGGGVKAIGLVGAIYDAEKRGYTWKRLAGNSAGSIIASLIAAGYTADELREEMLTIDYMKFIEKNRIGKIPMIGSLLNLLINYGIYPGDYIEQWVSDRLERKGKRTFSDLNNELYIIASDITSGEMLVLPNDIKRYGVKPDSLEIAKAVRMSCSIPYFFQPVKYRPSKKNKNYYIVDGGILSNFPVWLFDNPNKPNWPTFGFRLVTENTGKPNKINGPITMGVAIISTMMEAHDMRHIREQDYVRSILVPALDVKATDFDISKEKSEELFNAGVKASQKFFEEWNFSKYVSSYRTKKISI